VKLLETFISEPRECPYLPTEVSSLEYRIMMEISPEEWETLLSCGWRRFGVAYFRPRCADCTECVSLRIPVRDFKKSKSQKRVYKKVKKLRLMVGSPRIDAERLELYRLWHDLQGNKREWETNPMTGERYFHEFAFPHECVREFAYYDDEAETPRLVAVGIVDETPNALSAVYTYYHPDYANYSLGTGSILRQIDVARALNKEWLYLGYRVLGCQSSIYKQRFHPHELLQGRPDEASSAEWLPIIQ